MGHFSTASQVIGKSTRFIRRHGFREYLRASRIRCDERFHEWWFGIRTEMAIDPKDLGIHDPLCHEYGPTCFSEFRHLMRSVDVRKGVDVFLDYGSGLGRVVIMAATYPFGRVIGVELSPELNAIARENIDRARGKLTRPNIELFVADARHFAIPDDVTVIYFNNSFSGEILSSAMSNIRSSLERSSREISILFNLPTMACSSEGRIGQYDWIVKRREFQFTTNRIGIVYSAMLPPMETQRVEGAHCEGA